MYHIKRVGIRFYEPRHEIAFIQLSLWSDISRFMYELYETQIHIPI